jgi:hypothetical protein
LGKKGEFPMKKIMLKSGISTVFATIALAAIVIPVLAAAIWISVTPDNQTITSSLALWNVYMGKEAGCPETDLKFKVYFGDGYNSTYTNVRACSPWGVGHYLNSLGTFTQSWYVGQGSSGWTYRTSTTVTRTQ